MSNRFSSFNPSSSSSSTSPLSPSSLSSLTSSTLNSSSSIHSTTRCEGLDLLVEAVLHVSGSIVFDIPSATKRKRTSRQKKKKTFAAKNQNEKAETLMAMKANVIGIELLSRPTRHKRLPAFPSKYQDSVLQPWKRQPRQQRFLKKIDE